MVREIRTRIEGIDIEGILETSYLEQMTEDHHFSPFPQVQNTERADRAIANLLEGRVVILVDGTPFCLILSWWSGFSTPAGAIAGRPPSPPSSGGPT
ncbi:MAG: spore germination protein [Firmicutes bacterium]|nr:spore germination protein [Bacillota bacterium]